MFEDRGDPHPVALFAAGFLSALALCLAVGGYIAWRVWG